MVLDVEVRGTGPSRRTLLRGAAVGGTVLWTAPTIQLLSLTPASAQVASPVPCDAPASTSGEAVSVFERVNGREASGPSAESSQNRRDSSSGSAGPGATGLQNASATLVTVSSASTITSSVARTVATAEDVGVSVTAGGAVITVTALTSEATAQVTADGVVTLTPRSVVGVVTVNGTTITVPTTENQTVALPLGIGTLTFNKIVREPGTRTGTLTVVPLTVEVPGAGVLVELARTTASATFPACAP